MKTKVERPATNEYTAEGITLCYKVIGHNQVRVELPETLPAGLPEGLRKSVCRIKGVVRAKITSEGALLLTMRTRPARVSFKQLTNSALEHMAHKIRASRKFDPVKSTPQSKDKPRYVNSKTSQVLITT